MRDFRRSTAALILGLAAATTLSSAGPSDAAAVAKPAVEPAGVWSASLEGVHGVAPDATVRQIVEHTRLDVDVERFQSHDTSPIDLRIAGAPATRGRSRLRSAGHLTPRRR